MTIPYKTFERMSVEEQRSAQEEWLKVELNWAKNHSEYYGKRFETLDSKDPHWHIEDVPFMSKEELAKAGDALLCCPNEELLETVATSGTTGQPVWIHLCQSDLLRLREVERRAFEMMGLGLGDTAVLTVTMDRLFMAGLAYHQGLQQQGVRTLRLGPAQWDLAEDLCHRIKPQVLVAVPSTLKMWLDRWGDQPFPIKKALLIGEPLQTATGEASEHVKAIRSKADIRLHGSYGITEIQGSFIECEVGEGHHIHGDLHLVEVVDEKGQPVQNGASGEVVVSTLGVKAMPLFRFKTGDVARWITTPCACGRLSPRLGPVEGRLSQRLKVKGVNLYPNQVYRALGNIPEVSMYLLEAREESQGCDQLTVRCALSEEAWSAEALAGKLTESLRVKPLIVIEDESMLRKAMAQVSTRKEVRFIDYRNKK